MPNTWQVTETTEKGDVYEEFTGRQESVFSGPSIESETGKKKPSWMGSGDHYKPNITETTHAREITSVTKAKKIDSTETISGNKDETVETKAACSDHFEWTDITSGGKSTSVTKAKTFDERLNAGMVFSFDQFAKKEDNFAGTWTNNLEFGLHVDLSVHTVLNLHYDHVVLNLGLSFEIEKSLGASATVSIAPLINLTMNTVEADPPDINADLLTVVAKVQEQRIKALKQHAAALFTKQAPQWIRS